MATVRPFAYNTGTTLSGTIQYGTLSVGVDPNNPYNQNYCIHDYRHHLKFEVLVRFIFSFTKSLI